MTPLQTYKPIPPTTLQSYNPINPIHLFLRSIKLALRGLKANKLRAVLTTIGIIIGIATVIIVMSAGESAKSAVSDQLMGFGGNTIFAELSVPNTSHANSSTSIMQGVQITTLKDSDMQAALELPNVETGYSAIMLPEKITYQNTGKRTTILAASHTYPEIDETNIKQGRFFTVNEEKGIARVAVIGSELAEILFPGIDPIGRNIKIKQTNFEVIGVMEPKGTSFFMNMDEIAIIPVSTMQKILMGINHISYFVLKIVDNSLSAQTAHDLRVLLRKRHNIPQDQPEKDDFQVTTMEDSMDMVNAIMGGVSLLLTVIAIISLIVGGVGIMNIMYVSVSERTHEIGLKKAIGATSNNILLEFLLEAIVVTVVGGIIGIIGGLIITVLAGIGAKYAGFDWPVIISIQSVLLAFSASAVVGILFGIYPAKKAAKLDPIIALTRE